MLEPQRPADKALLAVVQEAYAKGVSIRKVDDLLKALGLAGIDKRLVPRICKELDQFRQHQPQESYPCAWLDALYLNVRQNYQVVNSTFIWNRNT
ncbi:MAG: transposase [Chloroflexota bacterium]|nr:MAG: transposase [Chloroflexota bacterium]